MPTVAELKAELATHGLPTTGLKAELMARLAGAQIKSSETPKKRKATPAKKKSSVKKAKTAPSPSKRLSRQSTLYAHTRDVEEHGGVTLRPHHRTDERYSGTRSSSRSSSRSPAPKPRKEKRKLTRKDTPAPPPRSRRAAAKKRRSSMVVHEEDDEEEAVATPKSKPSGGGGVSIMSYFSQSYSAYTAKERACKAKMHFQDFIAIPLFAAFYLVLAKYAMRSGDAAACVARAAVAPESIVYLAGACAIAGLVVMYQQVAVIPFPLEISSNWAAVQPVGRWIFLTRQTLMLQAVHLCYTFAGHLGYLDDELACAVAASSVFFSGLGIFVMIQFFALVVPNAHFLSDIVQWKERGVPAFEHLVIFAHVPCGILALVDVALLQDRALLLAMTPTKQVRACATYQAVPPSARLTLFSPFALPRTLSLQHLALTCVCYAVCYVIFMHLNFYATKCWPYGFMNGFGTANAKWFIFTISQTSIMVSFVAIAFATMTYAPQVW